VLRRSFLDPYPRLPYPFRPVPRLLFIGSGSPWLGGAGYLVRQNLFLHALAEVAELDLAMFDSKPEHVPPFVRKLVPLPPLVRDKPGRLGRLWADFTSPLPRAFRNVDTATARGIVASLNPETYDAVFAFRIDFAHFAGVLGMPRLLLDIDDPEHKRWRRRLWLTKQIDARTRRDVDRLEVFEKTAVATAAVSFVCQPADAVGWAVPPEVVPNCVDVVSNPVRAVEKPVVLFVGNCAGTDVSPNVDAVVWFLAEVWPLVLKAEPAAEFRLVGAAGDAVRRAVDRAPRATVAGFVDDLAAEYSAAAAAVAPIRFGTGTRLKILDAFAHACPVVSTLAGAEGIDAVPGKEIELGVGPEDFAARVIGVLHDQMLAATIGRGGHALVTARYDRLTEQKKLAVRLNELLAKLAR
jgi:glycosyltransferase involved in cell wall biosynthesis